MLRLLRMRVRKPPIRRSVLTSPAPEISLTLCRRRRQLRLTVERRAHQRHWRAAVPLVFVCQYTRKATVQCIRSEWYKLHTVLPCCSEDASPQRWNDSPPSSDPEKMRRKRLLTGILCRGYTWNKIISIIFQSVETCVKLFQIIFTGLTAAHKYFPTCWLSLN